MFEKRILRKWLPSEYILPWWLVVKNPPASAGDSSSIPRSRRSPGRGNGNPLQYSCLGNPIDRGAWQATVHRVAESGTTEQLTQQLKRICRQQLCITRNAKGSSLDRKKMKPDKNSTLRDGMKITENGK